MRYARTKTRKTILFSYVPTFALLTLIVCMSCGGKCNIEEKQKITSNQSKNVGHTDNLAANEVSKRINVPWLCINCNYISDKPNDVCLSCKREKGQLATTLQQAKIGLKIGKGQTPTILDFSSETMEDCPICFEEDAAKVSGAHLCGQCKKYICIPCYKQMQETGKHFCPLCRYDFCVD